MKRRSIGTQQLGATVELGSVLTPVFVGRRFAWVLSFRGRVVMGSVQAGRRWW